MAHQSFITDRRKRVTRRGKKRLSQLSKDIEGSRVKHKLQNKEITSEMMSVKLQTAVTSLAPQQVNQGLKSRTTMHVEL